jgi:hypothetical protein
MNDPKGRQVEFNASSRDQWAGFARHRRQVSSLLGAGNGPGAGRLCVLGAGNGNDLDLPALLRAHREVHLVDLDAGALARGAERQGVAGQTGLRLFGGVDLTGMLDAFATWSPTTPIDPDDLSALAEAPVRLVRPALPGPYELAASTCLLSPLIGNAFHAVGEAHPRFPELVRAIRTGHLRLLTGLVAPGGAAVLITDVASSDTLPTLRSLPESSLPGLLPRLVRDRSFFHGVSPAALASAYRRDPVLAAHAAAVEAIAPWRWNLHGRVYLVWAIRSRAPNPPTLTSLP